jgi:hypothetical protein
MFPHPNENDVERPSGQSREQDEERKFRLKYLILTTAIFLPLLWAFVKIRNVYPVAAGTMMMSGWSPERGRTYYILRGETLSGETVDVNPQELTDALSQQLFGMVGATMNNEAFKLTSPHPANVAWLESAGSVENLPRGARLPELLRAWGSIYNSELPANSPRRLKAIRLDGYRWEGGAYANYDRFIQSWREEL